MRPLSAGTVSVGRNESPGFTGPVAACWLPSDCQTPSMRAVFSTSAGGLGSGVGALRCLSAATEGEGSEEEARATSIFHRPSSQCFDTLLLHPHANFLCGVCRAPLHLTPHAYNALANNAPERIAIWAGAGAATFS